MIDPKHIAALRAQLAQLANSSDEELGAFLRGLSASVTVSSLYESMTPVERAHFLSLMRAQWPQLASPPS